MAGLGWRKFNAGEVLTANNFQSYAVDQSVQRYAGTAARGSAVGTAVSEGMMSWLDDTNVVQAYDGSAWNSLAYATAVPTLAQVGLVPMVPTSVDKSGGTATADSVGTVTFSGVSSVSLNGVFTSSFANYLVQWVLTGTADMVPNTKLRISGTDTTNDYWAGRLYQIDGSVGGQNNSTNAAWGISPNAVKQYFGTMNLYSPKASAPTYMTQASFLTTSSSSAASLAQQHALGARFDTSSFDGYTIYPSSGTISGTIRVFGYKA